MRHSPARALAFLLILPAVLPAAPPAPVARLACQATHTVECSQPPCRHDVAGGVQVSLDLSLPAGSGRLCAFGSCSDIRWVDPASGGTPQTFGVVHPVVGNPAATPHPSPAADFYLWVSSDRKTFGLIPIEGSTGSAWAGECR